MKSSVPVRLRASCLRHGALPRHACTLRPFSTSPKPLARNRIYESIRSLPNLTTTIALSTSSNRPLLALFTTSTNSTVHSNISALLLRLLEDEGVGEPEGGVGYAEVEMDAPDCAEVPDMYFITSVPTLMSFSRGEPQQLTKVTDIAELQDREFLRLWMENEAKRGGSGGAGGHPGGGGILGALFGLGGR